MHTKKYKHAFITKETIAVLENCLYLQKMYLKHKQNMEQTCSYF